MSLGKNLQYLRRLRKNMTQEDLAEKLSVSRQTVSKWEMDSALPEMEKAIELCRIFNCSLDNLFREEMAKRMDAISVEQINVYHMHGYTAAWVLPVGIQPEGLEIKVQPKHRYAAVHVENPFENPFVTIPSAYQALDSFMRVNGLVHTESGVIPCYETNGESMDINIACE